jgi:hypothetical protein
VPSRRGGLWSCGYDTRSSKEIKGASMRLGGMGSIGNSSFRGGMAIMIFSDLHRARPRSQ